MWEGDDGRMKRALAICIAAFAKSPGHTDSPTIIHILPPPGDGSFGNSGEDDEGDSDDLAGIKPGTRPDGGGGGPGGGALVSGYYPAGPEAKVWWMYFLRYVRIVF